MLRWYKPTESELLISKLYQTFGIRSPADIDLELIAWIWNVELEIREGKPFTTWENDSAVIFLSRELSEVENRAVFFHELCHPVKHAGAQDDLPELFRELQEIQAERFQLISAMPFYLLPPPETLLDEYAGTISELFKVPIELAVRRVEHLISRMDVNYLYHKKYIKQWRIYA